MVAKHIVDKIIARAFFFSNEWHTKISKKQRWLCHFFFYLTFWSNAYLWIKSLAYVSEKDHNYWNIRFKNRIHLRLSTLGRMKSINQFALFITGCNLTLGICVVFLFLGFCLDCSRICFCYVQIIYYWQRNKNNK